MNILARTMKVPGGLMLLPMLLAAVCHTFLPDSVKLGSPAADVFSGKSTMAVVGMMLVLAGIQFQPRSGLAAIKRGGLLVGVKLLIGILGGIAFMRFFGLDGFKGISVLAMVSCITSCNPGLYVALMLQYGDDVDMATFAFLSLIGLPFVPICILGFSAGQGINYMSIVATIMPFLLGVLLGVLDPAIRQFSQKGTSILLPFMGICLGSNINLLSAFYAWQDGLLLFVIFTLSNNLPMLLIDKYVLKQPGYASTAICCVAGLAIVVPQMMAEIDSTYAVYVSTATAQVATVFALSTVFTPWLTKKLASD